MQERDLGLHEVLPRGDMVTGEVFSDKQVLVTLGLRIGDNRIALASDLATLACFTHGSHLTDCKCVSSDESKMISGSNQ